MFKIILKEKPIIKTETSVVYFESLKLNISKMIKLKRSMNKTTTNWDNSTPAENPIRGWTLDSIGKEIWLK